MKTWDAVGTLAIVALSEMAGRGDVLTRHARRLMVRKSILGSDYL
jgi:hypothetical protein